jgi:hypothetical protein
MMINVVLFDTSVQLIDLSRVSANDLRASVEGPTVRDPPGSIQRREFGSGQGVPS